MSPRAACRLETLGFERVYDYVLGKADWLAHGLPREGEKASVPSAGDLCDPDPPTCALDDTLAVARGQLADAPYGFCLVVNEHRVLLGRVCRSALGEGVAGMTVEGVMESGPSTVRPSETAAELVGRLATRELHTAILTTPEGVLFGVFNRADAERQLAEGAR
jgi:CBS-domain-containing membrane protein